MQRLLVLADRNPWLKTCILYRYVTYLKFKGERGQEILGDFNVSTSKMGKFSAPMGMVGCPLPKYAMQCVIGAWMTDDWLPCESQPNSSTLMQTVRGWLLIGMKRTRRAMIGGRSSRISAMYVLLLPLNAYTVQTLQPSRLDCSVTIELTETTSLHWLLAYDERT